MPSTDDDENIDEPASTFPKTMVDAALGRETQRRSGRMTKNRQILDMQDALRAYVLSKETKPADVASCARSWDLLEERLRIMNNRLKPGSWNVSQAMEKSKTKRPGQRVVDVDSVIRSLTAKTAKTEPEDGQNGTMVPL